MTRTLVLAAGPGWAELAASHVHGDAVVQIGDPAPATAPSGQADFDRVVISGRPAEEVWLTACFDVATSRLAAGRCVVVIVADGDPDRVEAGVAPPRPVPLPPEVAAKWRVVGITVEYPVTGIVFQRSADVDGAAETADVFRRGQILSHAFRHPDSSEILDGTGGHEALQPLVDDPDRELALVRRELARYKRSTLGRLMDWYWHARLPGDGRFRKRRR